MLDEIINKNPESTFIVIDGYNDAITGFKIDDQSHLIYSQDKMYEIMLENGFEDYEECEEWFYYNIECLSHLENGPIFK